MLLRQNVLQEVQRGQDLIEGVLEEWSARAVSSQMRASSFLRVWKLLEPQDTAGDDHSYVRQPRGFCQEMWGRPLQNSPVS